MDIIMRFLSFLIHAIGIILFPIFFLINCFDKTSLPPIKNKLLKISAIDLADKIRKQEIKSQDVVQAYIDRIKEVNPYLNAVIENRYENAIKDAQKADQMCLTMNVDEIQTRYPLLGVPFTIKESVGLKGFSHVVGSVHRTGIKAFRDGAVVQNLKSAGCIPLLISNNPECCFSWETNNLINGKCKNPYDSRRTSGGSSGGEGALIGAGASVFGVGSDVAGSIRIPSLYNGIFGHKPTGGLLSNDGHFPNCKDPKLEQYLQVGPMCRYAKDLPVLLQIMAGKKSEQLDLGKIIYTKDIKIYYMEDLNFSFTRNSPTFDIQLSLLRAVEFFKRAGLSTEKLKISEFNNAEEIAFLSISDLQDSPNILIDPKNPTEPDNFFFEVTKNVCQNPKYSFQALFFNFLTQNRAFIRKSQYNKYYKMKQELWVKLLQKLDKNGVLFFPTFNTPALYHNMSGLKAMSYVFPTIWNALGFPATHVPMGLDSNGLPIGFQIVAAPYQDKLCLQIAAELENVFGGWVDPS